jgi:hypothetical protein
MPQVPGLARVLVDFNDLDDAGQLYTLPEDASRPLGPAVRVILWDGEGNTALGQVVEITEHGRAIIDMTPGTWSREPDEHAGLVGRLATPAPVAVVYTYNQHGLVITGHSPAPHAVQWRVSSAQGEAPETAAAAALVPTDR